MLRYLIARALAKPAPDTWDWSRYPENPLGSWRWFREQTARDQIAWYQAQHEKTRKARAAYRAARRGLNLTCGHTHECDEYYAAQDRVIRSEKRLPWWKRLDIDLTA